MTKHIKQRGYADCGVACIAMICDVEYERVLGSVAPDVYFHGLYAGEIIHAIKKISNKEFGYCEIPNLSFEEWWKQTPLIREEILIVERSGEWDEITKIHYVYFNKQDYVWRFNDPIEKESSFFSDYILERKDWKVIGTIHERRM